MTKPSEDTKLIGKLAATLVFAFGMFAGIVGSGIYFHSLYGGSSALATAEIIDRKNEVADLKDSIMTLEEDNYNLVISRGDALNLGMIIAEIDPPSSSCPVELNEALRMVARDGATAEEASAYLARAQGKVCGSYPTDAE